MKQVHLTYSDGSQEVIENVKGSYAEISQKYQKGRTFLQPKNTGGHHLVEIVQSEVKPTTFFWPDFEEMPKYQGKLSYVKLNIMVQNHDFSKINTDLFNLSPVLHVYWDDLRQTFLVQHCVRDCPPSNTMIPVGVIHRSAFYVGNNKPTIKEKSVELIIKRYCTNEMID